MTRLSIAKPCKGIILPADCTGWVPLPEITLEALQGAVGGYVTTVTIPHATLWAIDEAHGHVMNIYTALMFRQSLFGNVVITGGVDNDGETKGLGWRWMRYIMRRVPVADAYKNDPAIVAWAVANL